MKSWLFLICVSVQFSAQITLKVTEIPKDTPKNATIYVAGNFNGWNPNSTPLISDGKGNQTVTIPEGNGVIEYKFTRGNWNTAEGNASGNPISNRNSVFTGKPQTIETQILSWENVTEKVSTATKNVHLISDSFLILELGRTRKIWIYLPPDYETSKKKYPVIYMQDGQNLFDNATSFSGEWEIDETLNKLFVEGDYGAIVVGIDNGDSHRIDEYTPWKNPEYGGGEGDLYADFLAKTLKPFIDSHYRTKTGKKHNALIGSSLGALISNYAGIKYHNVFSKIGSFSPAYWIVNQEFNNYVKDSNMNLSATRIYFVAGSGESKTMTKDLETVKNNLQKKGLKPGNTFVKIDSYGQHNENYWKGEFREAYRWLFKTSKLKSKKNRNIQQKTQ